MPMLAQILGGSELLLILALILILLGAKHLPKLARGLGEGFFRFRKGFDQGAHDAGRSLGGVYGKPAAQALTTTNEVAELYDPAVFHPAEKSGHATNRMLRR